MTSHPSHAAVGRAAGVALALLVSAVACSKSPRARSGAGGGARGGTQNLELRLGIDTSALGEEAARLAQKRALDVVRTRLDSLKLAQPPSVRQRGDGIEVQLFEVGAGSAGQQRSDAQDLINVLKSGALPAPLRLLP